MRPGIITGFDAEARIMGRLTSLVATAGGVSRNAHDLAVAMVEQGADMLISCGIAGGLDPALAPGTIVIGRKVRSSEGMLAASLPLSDALASALPEAVEGMIAATDSIIDSAVSKRQMHRTLGAVAVDMESWGVASAATRMAVPFAILRVVADPAQRALPPAALVGMDESGNLRPGRVLKSLLSNPGQLSALIRVALDTRTALGVLSRAVGRLEPLFR